MIRILCLLAITTLLSCKKQEGVVTVTETRPSTSRDTRPKLDATSDERFRDAKPSPVLGNPPESWLARPATQMRLLNYRFGESGLGEVYVGISTGTVLANVNRWRREFGLQALDESGIDRLKTLPVAGASGVLLTAEGTYSPGRGQSPSDSFGLAGIIAKSGQSILTIKMVGPAAEVRDSIEELETFAAGLKWRDSGTKAEAPRNDD